MIKNINNVDINYNETGLKDKQVLVLLHGWGQNIKMMEPLANGFLNNFRIINIDLPGYGESSEPEMPWTVYDYTDALTKLFTELNVTSPIIIGHSFGGKLALILASKIEVKKLVLLASPYKASVKKKSLKVKILKALKKVPLLNKLEDIMKKHIGSTDYRQATPVMRKTLVNTVNEDVSHLAKNIKAPTLLIWGTEDKAVALSDAYELEKLIPDCGLVTFENCTHYAYLEQLPQTIKILKKFFGEE